MKYYSTNHQAPEATLREAVERGLAPDRGLYMPQMIRQLPASFFEHIDQLSFQEMSFEVAKAFFGDDVDETSLKQIVYDTLAFETPVVRVDDNIYSLELFHGPTLAFKDVGARFMARLLQYFIKKDRDRAAAAGEQPTGEVNVLVATSGDTGSAVANGFLGVDGIHVYVLYPKGKVSQIQESQFTTLGKNITAIEVDGVFDDCQALVKNAFMDKELNARLTLTSANSINVARFLPQAFYYFNAYAQMKKAGKLRIDADGKSNLVVCVPSGNFGNITAGLFAVRMGLPVGHFIAANNANDIFYNYLLTGEYHPLPSKQTLANAMDVGDPSNFARILALYDNSWEAIRQDFSGATYSDDRIRSTMQVCYQSTGYVLDPHGACGYQALKEQLTDGQVGVFLETAHPAKFKEKVDAIIGSDIAIPERLQAFMRGTKQSLEIANDYEAFKALLG
jgi:threonine synthase